MQYKEHVSAEAARNIEAWLTEPKYGEYRDELEQMIENEEWEALEDAFFAKITFGTAGIRGKVGLGSNRINQVLLGQATQGLCQYVQSVDADAPKKGIVIACDTRISSPELVDYVARVCAANGYKTYIFDGFRSTPQLSFSVRHLGCAAGIVVSASHNPPADNGFKAYWNDGGQLVAPHDKGVVDCAHAVEVINVLDSVELGVADGMIVRLDQAADDAYVARVAQESLTQGERSLSIVYSPLHGAGQTNTLPVLKAAGFTDIRTVDDQMVPDGHFPTIPDGKANPQAKPANAMAVALLEESAADIAITNDPDADRFGIMVRHNNQTQYLNGNQSLVLAADYVLSAMHKKGELPNAAKFITKTIVTTDMLEPIAQKYGATLYGNLLVGFKYIGELATKKATQGEQFILGGEESYGFLKGDYARDKDGAVGALCLAEYADTLKQQGKTLYDRMLELYAEYGVYHDLLTAVSCAGASGFKQMQTIMQSLRDTPPKEIAGYKIAAVRDYQSGIRTTNDGVQEEIDCIRGNVIMLEFEDTRRKLTIRPSGTEPIIKLYAQWYESVDGDAQDTFDAVCNTLETLSRAFEAEAKGRA